MNDVTPFFLSCILYSRVYAIFKFLNFDLFLLNVDKNFSRIIDRPHNETSKHLLFKFFANNFPISSQKRGDI